MLENGDTSIAITLLVYLSILVFFLASTLKKVSMPINIRFFFVCLLRFESQVRKNIRISGLVEWPTNEIENCKLNF